MFDKIYNYYGNYLTAKNLVLTASPCKSNKYQQIKTLAGKKLFEINQKNSRTAKNDILACSWLF